MGYFTKLKGGVRDAIEIDYIGSMGDGSEISQRVRAYLKRLGNPYASTQIDGFKDDVAFGVADSPRAVLRAPKINPAASRRLRRQLGQRDLFANVHDVIRDVQRSGNPYASLARTDDKEQRSHLASDGSLAGSPKVASKSEFESGTRRIFAQYIPALERGRLRPEHRDFITRNKSRPAGIRFRLLQALRKYDLSQISGVQPQFNRENEPLTIQKLREIELAVGEDE